MTVTIDQLEANSGEELVCCLPKKYFSFHFRELIKCADFIEFNWLATRPVVS